MNEDGPKPIRDLNFGELIGRPLQTGAQNVASPVQPAVVDDELVTAKVEETSLAWEEMTPWQRRKYVNKEHFDEVKKKALSKWESIKKTKDASKLALATQLRHMDAQARQKGGQVSEATKSRVRKVITNQKTKQGFFARAQSRANEYAVKMDQIAHAKTLQNPSNEEGPAYQSDNHGGIIMPLHIQNEVKNKQKETIQIGEQTYGRHLATIQAALANNLITQAEYDIVMRLRAEKKQIIMRHSEQLALAHVAKVLTVEGDVSPQIEDVTKEAVKYGKDSEWSKAYRMALIKQSIQGNKKLNEAETQILRDGYMYLTLAPILEGIDTKISGSASALREALNIGNAAVTEKEIIRYSTGKNSPRVKKIIENRFVTANQKAEANLKKMNNGRLEVPPVPQKLSPDAASEEISMSTKDKEKSDDWHNTENKKAEEILKGMKGPTVDDKKKESEDKPAPAKPASEDKPADGAKKTDAAITVPAFGSDTKPVWDRTSVPTGNEIFYSKQALKDAMIARLIDTHTKGHTGEYKIAVTPEGIRAAEKTLDKWSSPLKRALAWATISALAASGGVVLGAAVASSLLPTIGLWGSVASGFGAGILGNIFGRKKLKEYAGGMAGSTDLNMSFEEHMRSASALNRTTKEFSRRNWFSRMFLGETAKDHHDHLIHIRHKLENKNDPQFGISFAKAQEAWDKGYLNEGRRLFGAGLFAGVLAGGATAYGIDQYGSDYLRRPGRMLIDWFNTAGTESAVGARVTDNGVGKGVNVPVGDVPPGGRGGGTGIPDNHPGGRAYGEVRKILYIDPSDGSQHMIPVADSMDIGPRATSGFGPCERVSGFRGGFESLVKKSVGGVNWDYLGFGAGKKSPFTDLFEQALQQDPSAASKFFGVDPVLEGNGKVDVQSMAYISKYCGRGLDYSVLIEDFKNSGKTMIRAMTDRALQISAQGGDGGRGKLVAQILESMNKGVLDNPNASLWARVRT